MVRWLPCQTPIYHRHLQLFFRQTDPDKALLLLVSEIGFYVIQLLTWWGVDLVHGHGSDESGE